MNIKQSRRILVLGEADCGALDLLKELTGSAPTTSDGSIAGLLHEWNVETAYYTANVPIWIDELKNIEDWKEEFMKPEAREVVEAVGAWVYCFRRGRKTGAADAMEITMQAIQSVVEEHGGYGVESVMLAVAMPDHSKASDTGLAEQFDDIAIEHGFEFIEFGQRGTNEHGEKVGFERFKEALEANEWEDAGNRADIELHDLDFDVDDDVNGFGREEAEMTAELFGMKAALSGSDDFDPDAEDFPPTAQAAHADDLGRMMGKLLAIKEQSADLPEAQRKRLAAQTVRDIMKDNPSV